jgi:hypothetical protein
MAAARKSAQKTPLADRKAKNLAALQEAKDKGAFKKMEDFTQEQQEKFRREVATLQSRVSTASVDVDLGGGDKIAVRTSLLDVEVSRMEDLELSRMTETDPVKQEAIACEMIELITLNPIITKDWLLENRDKYSPEDLLSILIGFLEVRLQKKTEYLENLRRAVSFRAIGKGSELRGVPSTPGNLRSS